MKYNRYMLHKEITYDEVNISLHESWQATAAFSISAINYSAVQKRCLLLF